MQRRILALGRATPRTAQQCSRVGAAYVAGARSGPAIDNPGPVRSGRTFPTAAALQLPVRPGGPLARRGGLGSRRCARDNWTVGVVPKSTQDGDAQLSRSDMMCHSNRLTVPVDARCRPPRPLQHPGRPSTNPRRQAHCSLAACLVGVSCKRYQAIAQIAEAGTNTMCTSPVTHASTHPSQRP